MYCNMDRSKDSRALTSITLPKLHLANWKPLSAVFISEISCHRFTNSAASGVRYLIVLVLIRAGGRFRNR